MMLIDWEYAGMADPLIDVAMFAIYAYYSRQEIDTLLEIYLLRKATKDEIMRVYLLAALGGFCWSVWTEYNQSLGVEFGDYGMKMYRYAKDFYKYVQEVRQG
jgi:thiamine kinase-like enzyme